MRLKRGLKRRHGRKLRLSENIRCKNWKRMG
jgi:hypothetical protein